MGRLVCLALAAALLVASGGQAAAALPSEIPWWPVSLSRCADDLSGRERARQAVREARERHGAHLAAMLRDHPTARGTQAIVQADAMLAHIGTEADAVLVTHGACAAGEVLRRALSAMDTVAGLTPTAVAAAEATPRPTPRPSARVVAASRPRVKAAATPRPSATPRPRPTATPRATPRPKPLATARPTPSPAPLFQLRQTPRPVPTQQSR